MDEVIKIVLPFLTTSRTYSDVLTKLASFAFYETYIITLALRTDSRVDQYFKGIESWGAFGNIIKIVPHSDVLNLSGLFIAFFIAILTHMLQFHDRISDLFGIRRRFDQRHILIPLAQGVGLKTSATLQTKIKKHRHSLMHAVFYRFASSRNDNALVDKHDIEHAINAWSWFWTCVEGCIYFAIGSATAWWLHDIQLAKGFVLVAVVFGLVGAIQRLRLPNYAKPQVETIIRDHAASATVKAEFDAL